MGGMSVISDIKTFLDNIGTCVVSKETSTQIKAKVYLSIGKLNYRNIDYILYKSALMLITKAKK